MASMGHHNGPLLTLKITITFFAAVFKSESNESLKGRGGGGAPVRDADGRLLANFHTWKESEFVDPETKRKYLEELRKFRKKPVY